MSSQAIPAPRSTIGSPVTPLLRAVLLADLVDSTAFVEGFGDERAARVLQRLDLQIRDLLDFTGGRLIDKADGLLAIFERPIQAVDFALRYQQAMRQFGQEEGIGLSARVGIHVGEVMTWSNSDKDVLAGAKPLEVEGLAKPMAARLMGLAMPGQVLVSSMAQALAQRAQAELGERAERVRWLAHGRYRFKGVPAPLLVHEVGEVGVAPLKQPPSGSKVWRELPLWRRPPVVLAEAILVVCMLGFYAFTVLRSPPAIAFQERDWVVVGDLSNFTGDPRLDESLETALRVSLEQSRFVNVVPAMKVQAVLRNHAEARRLLGTQGSTGFAGADLDARLPEVTYALDQGHLAEAISAAKSLADTRADAALQKRTYFGTWLLLRSYTEGKGVLPELRSFARAELARAQMPGDPDVVSSSFAALAAASFATRLGDVATGREVLAALEPMLPALGYPALDDMQAVLRAELDLQAGAADRAAAALRSRVDGGELNWVHVVLGRAYAQAGRLDEARTQAAWLASHRGRAFVEWNSQYLLQPLNVLESNLALLDAAEMARDANDEKAAQAALRPLAAAWRDPPAPFAARMAAVQDWLSQRRYRTGRTRP